MAVGEDARGASGDGGLTARVRAPGPSTARIVRVRRPFALVGSHPDAEIRLVGPAVEPAHALLLLDRRGVFGVDLLSRSGTRFAGAESGSAWLGPGDILEVAGHRVELLRLVVDGRAIDPPLGEDDPLAPCLGGLVALALEPLGAPGPGWTIGSPLAFLGRAEGCAIRVEDAAASEVHCALARGTARVHLIALPGRASFLDCRLVEGASALLDGDVLAIGRARFGVRVGPAGGPPSPGREVALPGADPSPDALLVRLIDAVGQAPGPDRAELLDLIRRLRDETSALMGAQIDRIESLGREVAALRDEVRGHHGLPDQPAAPFRLDLQRPTPGPGSADSVAWLLDRLRDLDDRGRPAPAALFDRTGPTFPRMLPARPPDESLPRSLEPPESPL